MNSQKVHCDTKPCASDLLSPSLQLPQQRREVAEGMTKNLNKPGNIKSVDTRHGVNNKISMYLRRLRNFRHCFWVEITCYIHHSLQ